MQIVGRMMNSFLSNSNTSQTLHTSNHQRISESTMNVSQIRGFLRVLVALKDWQTRSHKSTSHHHHHCLVATLLEDLTQGSNKATKDLHHNCGRRTRKRSKGSGKKMTFAKLSLCMGSTFILRGGPYSSDHGTSSLYSLPNLHQML